MYVTYLWFQRLAAQNLALSVSRMRRGFAKSRNPKTGSRVYDSFMMFGLAACGHPRPLTSLIAPRLSVPISIRN